MRFLFLGDLEITLSVILTSLGQVRHAASPQAANLALEEFGTLWCFVLGLVAKVDSTAECFSSSRVAENFVSTLRYWHYVSHAISTFTRESEVGARGSLLPD